MRRRTKEGLKLINSHIMSMVRLAIKRRGPCREFEFVNAVGIHRRIVRELVIEYGLAMCGVAYGQDDACRICRIDSADYPVIASRLLILAYVDCTSIRSSSPRAMDEDESRFCVDEIRRVFGGDNPQKQITTTELAEAILNLQRVAYRFVAPYCLRMTLFQFLCAICVMGGEIVLSPEEAQSHRMDLENFVSAAEKLSTICLRRPQDTNLWEVVVGQFNRFVRPKLQKGIIPGPAPYLTKQNQREANLPLILTRCYENQKSFLKW